MKPTRSERIWCSVLLSYDVVFNTDFNLFKEVLTGVAAVNTDRTVERFAAQDFGAAFKYLSH